MAGCVEQDNRTVEDRIRSLRMSIPNKSNESLPWQDIRSDVGQSRGQRIALGRELTSLAIMTAVGSFGGLQMIPSWYNTRRKRRPMMQSTGALREGPREKRNDIPVLFVW
jgi:hypothetical protein